MRLLTDEELLRIVDPDPVAAEQYVQELKAKVIPFPPRQELPTVRWLRQTLQHARETGTMPGTSSPLSRDHGTHGQGGTP